SWSGGEAGADVLSRLVPTTAAGLYAVTASADKSITRTIKVAAWTDGEAPTVELTGAVDGDAVLSPTSIEVDPGMVVALGLRNWSDLDANEFAASEQDEWDVGATVWTVKVRRVDPDTQVVTWVDRPDLTRTGATYSFRVPCGGTYAIAGAVPDHGLLAKDSAPAAVTSTVTVLHPCGTNCGQ
ncbi:MAG: hypothetical protein HZB16_15725, partial [Armatimonadetes bacterium]|nr:hypothetical protein [Armatimonadota bacterium]